MSNTMDTAGEPGFSPCPHVVAVDGSDNDWPALAWAVEEASSAKRRLLIAHAAGHLTPTMSYSERHLARRERRAAGLRLVDKAAGWVHDLAPELTVDVLVRLLGPSALLSPVGRDA